MFRSLRSLYSDCSSLEFHKLCFFTVCEILVYPTLLFIPTPAIRCTVKTPAGFARNPAMLAQPASNPFVQVFYSNKKSYKWIYITWLSVVIPLFRSFILINLSREEASLRSSYFECSSLEFHKLCFFLFVKF